MRVWAQRSGDLSPGDRQCASFDWGAFEIRQVSIKTPQLFETAYDLLWNEFGSRGELEQKQVLLERLKWDPSEFRNHHSLGYEMLVVLKQDRVVAIRDHSVIISKKNELSLRSPEAFVHLSHVWIDPEFRGTGMIGWLRAWPIQTARSCLTQAGLPSTTPITLVAEMEPPDPSILARIVRLKSYERAGFLSPHPNQVSYFQPDFRLPIEIDSSGGPSPLLLQLVIRRVGRDTETKIFGHELKTLVHSLYHMYSSGFRPQDMQGLWEQLEKSYPPCDAQLNLVPPYSGTFAINKD